MSAHFEFWLTDDGGKRIMLLDRFAFVSYSRIVSGFGTFSIGLPFREFSAQVSPFFRPDWRVDVWRSPEHGYPMRREGVYLLRKPKVYTRKEDSVEILELYGRSPVDLLNRRFVIQKAGTSYTEKEAEIDDMMKEIVREQMLAGQARDGNGLVSEARAYPADEFSVQRDYTLGPSVIRKFAGRNVLDILKELRENSMQLNEEDTAYRRVYFDVVARELAGFLLYILDEAGNIILDEDGEGILDENSVLADVPLGFEFQTFMDLRGADRTDQLEFSVENGNLQAPFYALDHFEETNAVYVKGPGRGQSAAFAKTPLPGTSLESTFVEDETRIQASRWNRSEGYRDASSETSADALLQVGRAELTNGRPREELYCAFLSTPGSDHAPRSLYGIDWDLGDRVRVSYAGLYRLAEIMIVYVSIDESGQENVSGRSDVGEIS